MGFGTPMRTPGYILGYVPNQDDSIYKRRSKGSFSNNYNKRKDDDSF